MVILSELFLLSISVLVINQIRVITQRIEVLETRGSSFCVWIYAVLFKASHSAFSIFFFIDVLGGTTPHIKVSYCVCKRKNGGVVVGIWVAWRQNKERHWWNFYSVASWETLDLVRCWIISFIQLKAFLVDPQINCHELLPSPAHVFLWFPVGNNTHRVSMLSGS